MTLNTLFAYRNTRPDKDWNTCGQAAMATILDFHKIDPFGLPRNSAGHWNDGQIIDALINDGMGPDVVFGWGTTPTRLAEALGRYGLGVTATSFIPFFPRSRSQLFADLRELLARDLPVPVLVSVSELGVPVPFGAHWPVAFKVENNRVHLAACPWNPTPTITQFISAWHAWFLPMGMNWASVRAVPSAAQRWPEQSAGALSTSDAADVIRFSVVRGAVNADQVEFRLHLSGAVTWAKRIEVPNGTGTFTLFAEGRNGQAAQQVPLASMVGGRYLNFSKPKFMGHWTPVLRLGDLRYLIGGDRVLFEWARD